MRWQLRCGGEVYLRAPTALVILCCQRLDGQYNNAKIFVGCWVWSVVQYTSVCIIINVLVVAQTRVGHHQWITQSLSNQSHPRWLSAQAAPAPISQSRLAARAVSSTRPHRPKPLFHPSPTPTAPRARVLPVFETTLDTSPPLPSPPLLPPPRWNKGQYTVHPCTPQAAASNQVCPRHPKKQSRHRASTVPSYLPILARRRRCSLPSPPPHLIASILPSITPAHHHLTPHLRTFTAPRDAHYDTRSLSLTPHPPRTSNTRPYPHRHTTRTSTSICPAWAWRAINEYPRRRARKRSITRYVVSMAYQDCSARSEGLRARRDPRLLAFVLVDANDRAHSTTHLGTACSSSAAHDITRAFSPRRRYQYAESYWVE